MTFLKSTLALLAAAAAAVCSAAVITAPASRISRPCESGTTTRQDRPRSSHYSNTRRKRTRPRLCKPVGTNTKHVIAQAMGLVIRFRSQHAKPPRYCVRDWRKLERAGEHRHGREFASFRCRPFVGRHRRARLGLFTAGKNRRRTARARHAAVRVVFAAQVQCHTIPDARAATAGTNDGLTRVTRMMESYYHINMNVTDDFRARNPVITIGGLSHAQYFDGPPPPLVKARDLKPELDLPTARQQIALVAANYMEQLMTPAPDNANYIAITLDLVNASGNFYAPLLNAFYQEGYAFFRMPCNLVDNATGCLEGCPWTEYMQEVMAKGDDGVAPGFDVRDHDDFQRVYHLPDVHLPQIDNSCNALENCVLLTRSVTQGVYSVPTWELDTAFFPQSADELRAKMNSRQRMYYYGGNNTADFDVTDGADWCAKLNQVAYEWGRNHTDPLTLKRFDAVGQPMVMGADIVENSGGPLWIWTGLDYQNVTDANNTLVLQVRSPMMKTSMDYWISFSRGFHYCKLLSPARVMEWIYVDGLRARNGI